MRRFLALVTAGLFLAGAALAPSAALGGGPPGTPIPPLRSDGPIALPDGRVLPVKPASVHEASVQAEMLAAHAGDRITFVPGERPRARNEALAALAPLGGEASVVPLELADPSGAAATLAAGATLPNGMRKEVFGFLPYWQLDAASLQWMQYQLVTSIAYFGVAARADGTLAMTSGGSTTAGWGGWNSSAMTGVINSAHARGVRVVLTVTMMAWDSASAQAQAALLGNATARSTLVNAIVEAVRNRAADGVNLDFEPVSTTLRDQYTSFVRQLKAGLASAGVGSYLTVDTTAGAATWASGYDLVGLTAAGAADALFVMGYDFSWSGSARAGGVAPMDSPYILDVGEAVDDYLATVPAGKVIWGVPYYGRTWQTTTGDLNAPTRAGASGASKAYYYSGARTLATTHGRRWDDVGKVPWFAYYDSTAATWVEGYYDDAVSLGAKWDMVNQRDLAGTGIWTLLMDEGDNALWTLIAGKFASDTTPPSGGIGDLPSETDATSITVRWAATDVGSGVKSYTVQVRDRSRSNWVGWLTATTATSATFAGVAGHSYEFRVAAVDFKGNAQPWQAAAPDPGTVLAAGGFAVIGADALNVRSGAGTTFGVASVLTAGDLVAVLAGPIDAGGYQWYQVQFGFGEWPSAAYPQIGWVAAGSGGTAYLSAASAPNTIAMVPGATGFDVTPALVGSYPVANASVVSVAVQPAVQFDRVVAGVGTASFMLRRPDGTAVPAIVTNDGESRQFTLHPSAQLQQGTTYTVALTSAIGGVEGGALAPTSWSFTTWGTAPPPSGSTTFSPAVQVLFKMGTHTGYQFSSSGAVTASKSYTLTKDSGAATSQRATLTNQSGSWLYITNGVWAGYWLRQSSVLYVAATPISAPGGANATFSPTVQLLFRKGTHTGYQFSSTGALTASKTYTLANDSGAATSARSTTLTNQAGTWFYVTNGVWAGYWLRASDALGLASG